MREKFLKFFEKNNHVIIPSASLIPSEEEQLAGKEKVLFTSAGMQPLIPYLMGKPHPKGKKLANVQKCLRTDDIEEVGDHIHHTFFEMLGNWSLGDYWKDEAIRLSFEFLTKELEIPVEKLAISVFAGDEDAPKDEQSANEWKSLGIPEKRIAYLGKEANWWPTNPSSIGPCGPDTEMFVWTGKDITPEEFDPKDSKWVEVWNDVFMQFNRKEDGSLEELPQKNVDTGMGLERILAVINGKDDDYQTDLYLPIIRNIEQISGKKYEENPQVFRVIADHMRAGVALIVDGVRPANKLHGYILRRLLRRSAVKMRQLGNDSTELSKLVDQGSEVINEEIVRFNKTLDHGLKEIGRIEVIDGKKAFYLYQTFGFPYEVTEELFRQKGQEIDKEQFRKEFEKHKELSRSASSGIFKGGLADHSDVVIKYHTATHLLHQALRDVLGPQVFQKGSNITAERLRFDFSFDRKMTDEEIKQTEDLVNQKIREDLKVDHKIVSLKKAKEMGAIGLFDEKYGTEVSVYGIGPREDGSYYSLEFCGGPHVEYTGTIGRIKITKEEAVSAGVRRIKAEIMLR